MQLSWNQIIYFKILKKLLCEHSMAIRVTALALVYQTDFRVYSLKSGRVPLFNILNIIYCHKSLEHI